MADEKLELDIIISAANSAKTVGEIKQSLKDINKALQDVEVDSKAFRELTTAAGKAKAEMMDLKGQIKGLDPDNRIAGFGKVLGGVANGFSAATSAAALFGNQSEDLQKTLLKVQAGMAFANAIQGVMELGDAFKVLNAIIRANPIGALITALTAVVAIGAKIYDQFFSLEAQLKENVELANMAYEIEKKKLDALNSQENVLKLQGKTDREILELKIKQTDEVIKAGEAQLIAQIELNKEQEETARRGKEILQNILGFLTIPIKFLTQQIDWIMNALGEDSNLTKNLDKNIAEIFFDPEETKKKGDDTLKEMQNQLDALKNQRAGFILSIQKMDADAHAEELKRLKEQQGKKMEFMDFEKKTNEQNADIQIKSTIEQVEEENALIDRRNAYRLEQQKKIADARLAIEQSLFSSLASLGTLFFKNAEKAEKFQKALAVTQLAVDTAKAISGAISGAMTLPFPASLGAVAVGIATVLANMAKAKQLLAKAGGSNAPQLDTGGVSAPISGGIPNLNPQPQSSTLLNPDGTVYNPNAQQPQPVKAYVVETEMTTAQQRIRSIEERSRY